MDSWSFFSKYWKLLFIASISLALYFSGITQYLSWTSLKQNRAWLRQTVEEHSTLAPFLYVGTYILVISCSLPGATVLTLSGGVLFKQPFATIYSVVGAATGACIVFYLASTTFGETLRNKVKQYGGEWIEKLLKENEPVHMMLLRLVPTFPFWLINIAPSVFGVKMKTFAWTTFVGIIPGSYLYTQAGREFDEAIESDVDDETLSGFLKRVAFNDRMITATSILLLWLAFLLFLKWYMARVKKQKAQ